MDALERQVRLKETVWPSILTETITTQVFLNGEVTTTEQVTTKKRFHCFKSFTPGR